MEEIVVAQVNMVTVQPVRSDQFLDIISGKGDDFLMEKGEKHV